MGKPILFQSTPPARGATTLAVLFTDLQIISIHAPREGGDVELRPLRLVDDPISIHAPPRGGRPWWVRRE